MIQIELGLLWIKYFCECFFFAHIISPQLRVVMEPMTMTRDGA